MQYCIFCGNDPYHYVDIGVGMQAAAIVCCDYAIYAYGGDKKLQFIGNLLSSTDSRRNKRGVRLFNKFKENGEYN